MANDRIINVLVCYEETGKVIPDIVVTRYNNGETMRTNDKGKAAFVLENYGDYDEVSFSAEIYGYYGSVTCIASAQTAILRLKK